MNQNTAVDEYSRSRHFTTAKHQYQDQVASQRAHVLKPRTITQQPRSESFLIRFQVQRAYDKQRNRHPEAQGQGQDEKKRHTIELEKDRKNNAPGETNCSVKEVLHCRYYEQCHKACWTSITCGSNQWLLSRFDIRRSTRKRRSLERTLSQKERS